MITKQNEKNRKNLNTLYLVEMERWHRMLSTLVTPAAYTAESKDAHAILSDGRIVITINTYTAGSKDAHAILSDGRIVISDDMTINTYRAESKDGQAILSDGGKNYTAVIVTLQYTQFYPVDELYSNL